MNGWDYVDATQTLGRGLRAGLPRPSMTGPPHTATIIFHCGIIP